MIKQDLFRHTALARPIDPARFNTNLYILILTALTGIIGGVVALMQGDDLLDAIFTGLNTGGATLVAWIIAREIDPDYDLAAFVAAGLAFAAVILLATGQHFLALAGVVLMTRMVARTVGPPATLVDSIIVLVIGLLVVFVIGDWLFAVPVAAAFLLDAVLHNPNRLGWGFGGLALVGMAVYIALEGTGTGELSVLPLLAALAISGLFAWTISGTRACTSGCDQTGDLLNPARVRAAMTVALLSGLALLTAGDTGIAEMAALWATLLGVSIYRLAIQQLQRNQGAQPI